MDNFGIKDISNTITFDSIMRGFGTRIYAEIASSESMSMAEILSSYPKKEHQTVMRRVKWLVKEGHVAHERIWGKGKRKRYFVKEEDTKNKLLIRIVEGNKKKYKISFSFTLPPNSFVCYMTLFD